MRSQHSKPVHAGFTLSEVMIAMAVVAIAVPLVLGLVVAGGESSRQAERETRAVMSARSVFEELRRALNGNSEFVSELDLPWGSANAAVPTGGVGGDDGTGDDDWLILELNKDGEIIGQATDMQYQDAWEGDNFEVRGLAAVRGYTQEVENVELVDGEPLRVFRIEVRIESPALAEAEFRERVVFIQSDSLR